MDKKAMTQEAIIKMALGVLVLLVLIFIFADPSKTFAGVVRDSCTCTSHQNALENACADGETIVYGKLAKDENCQDGSTGGSIVRCCAKK